MSLDNCYEITRTYYCEVTVTAELRKSEIHHSIHVSLNKLLLLERNYFAVFEYLLGTIEEVARF